MNQDLLNRILNTKLFQGKHKFSRGEALFYLTLQADQDGVIEKNIYRWSEDWNWPRTNVYRFLEYLQKIHVAKIETGQENRTGETGQVKTFIKLSFLNSYEEKEQKTGQGKPDMSTGQVDTNGKIQSGSTLNGTEKPNLEAIQKRIDFEYEKLSMADKEKWDGYQQYLNDEGLYRIKLFKQPLTPGGFLKLLGRFGSDIVAQKLKAIENVPDCHEKYASLYLTLEDWCSKEMKRQQK